MYNLFIGWTTIKYTFSKLTNFYQNLLYTMEVFFDILRKKIFGLALLLILYGLYFFIEDFYLTLYRLYWDSTLFTRIYNNVSLFLAKWLPF